MIKDGLWDAFNGYHMGNTARMSRGSTDHPFPSRDEIRGRFPEHRPRPPQKAGKFKDEIVPVTIKTRKGGHIVADDEYPRHGAKPSTGWPSSSRPSKKDGTVTAGSASGINDGAAAVVLMTAKQAAKEGKKVLGRIVSWGQAGVDPKIMGTARSRPPAPR